MTHRAIRVAVVAFSVSVGATLMWLAEPVVGTAVALFVLSIGLVVPLAVAKTATACGLNVLSDLASTGRPLSTRLSETAIFAITAMLTATSLGLLLSAAGEVVGAVDLLPAAGFVFLVAGLFELGFIRARHTVTLPWQVPVEWVRGRHAPVIWGLLLGTGLTTYMPHPSFFGLLAMAFVLPFPFGPALMAVYGATRTLPSMVAAVQRTDGFLARLHEEALLLRVFGHATTGAASFVLVGAFWLLLLT